MTRTLKTYVSALALASLAMALPSCSGSSKEETEDRELAEADSIFTETVKLTNLYIGKVKALPDTADVAAVMDEYNTRLNALNLKGSPMVDKYMSELQNDSLHHLQQRLVALARTKKQQDTPEAEDSSEVDEGNDE